MVYKYYSHNPMGNLIIISNRSNDSVCPPLHIDYIMQTNKSNIKSPFFA